ncbi:MAG: hypothetical protein FIB07_13575 [Candidatus Methanoperedens sp.]|nr:hypothetical protein [Candidatus Methanoperedens sp.]
MCGIFGIAVKNDSGINSKQLKSIVTNLFKLSESRGKEAAGIAINSDDEIKVYKCPVPASVLIDSKEFNEILDSALNISNKKHKYSQPVTIIGHSRLVTNGARQVIENNQPVIKDGIVGIHNGIIVNNDELWNKFPYLGKKYDVDTEILLSLIRYFYNHRNSLINAVQESFRLIKGTASVALLFNDINHLLLATNNGSLYLCKNSEGNIYIFASELYILNTVIKQQKLQKILGNYEISQVRPGIGYVINTHSLDLIKIELNNKECINYSIKKCNSLKNINVLYSRSELNDMISNQRLIERSPQRAQRFYPDTRTIKRCAKCLLPETMPFIEYDVAGVCNYCRNHKKTEVMGKDALEKLAAKYRSKSGDPDCIVAFSGGRDSSYGLHYVKNVLKMNPITYTYDWGMVTDLARRNIARMCGKLGVENVLVSADINKKRENIRKNVNAWLKKPDLGMIPLFMAGDKQYFYYANKLMEETGIKLVILCENMLENTFFKSGYCGIKPGFGGEHTYSLAGANKIKLAAYYLNQYIRNPSYINSSIFDTMSAYFSYYMMPHEYLNLYRYIEWNEKEIESTLIKEYEWELAPDTRTTWRIGDGTAAFYNYIYGAITGFTENDTFRSNQIREGMITREKALELVEDENKPRYESIKWYCDTIGINFDETLEIINSVPRIYETRFQGRK